MDADFSIIYARFQELGADALRLLPNLMIGIG